MASNLPMSYILSLATYNLPSHFVHVPLFWLYIYIIYFFCFCFVFLGIELRAYTLSHSTSFFFVMDFFEIGSQELFAKVDFKPPSF
jgi:hypothetical protein